MATINNIIPNGSIVKTKTGDIEAIVIGVVVRGERNEQIEYEITWFANAEYKSEWVQSFEIILKIDSSSPIGFARNNQTLLK